MGVQLVFNSEEALVEFLDGDSLHNACVTLKQVAKIVRLSPLVMKEYSTFKGYGPPWFRWGATRQLYYPKKMLRQWMLGQPLRLDGFKEDAG